MKLRGHLRKELQQLVGDPVGLAVALAAPPLVVWVFSRVSLREVQVGAAFSETSPVALVLCLALWLSNLATASAALYRERLAGTLQRLQATPYSPEVLVGAKALVLGALGLLQAGLVWVAARWLLADELGAARATDVLPALGLLALSAVATGLLVAALLPSPTQVSNSVMFLTLVLISLSGFFKPLADMGAALHAFAGALPFTLAYQATRGSVDGTAASIGSFAGLGVEVVTLVGLAVVTLRVGARLRVR